MHTPEQLRQTADAIEANKRSEPCEFCCDGIWRPTTLSWDQWNPEYAFRPAPKPATRPWNCAADVPIGCLIKMADGWYANPASIFEDGISFARRADVTLFTWRDLSGSEYTIDGETFHPCTVPI